MELEIGYKRKKLFIQARRLSFLGKVRGLMFRIMSGNTPNLLFEFRDSRRWGIHSFFVFGDFLAVWLDERNNVSEFKVVKPFTPSVRPKKPFRKLLEVPVNDSYYKVLDFLVAGGKI